MKTEVLLEKIAENQFRVMGSGTFALTVEGRSREEALQNFQKAAADKVPAQAEVVSIDVPLTPLADIEHHPWAWFAGILKDEPLFEEYQAGIERNRQRDEENEARRLFA